MTRYRKLRTALAAALKGEPVDLDTLREDDRALIVAVQAQRVSNTTLAERATNATKDFKAQSYIVEALGEQLFAASEGRTVTA